MGLYAFNGTGDTGSFAGKRLLSQFKLFMQSDDDILIVLAAFGIKQEMYRWSNGAISMFTVMFFGIIAKTIGDLRWALFAQKGKEGQQIPTPRTLVSHTSRSFYMFLVWKLKHLALTYPHLRPTIGICRGPSQASLLSDGTNSKSVPASKEKWLQNWVYQTNLWLHEMYIGLHKPVWMRRDVWNMKLDKPDIDVPLI